MSERQTSIEWPENVAAVLYKDIDTGESVLVFGKVVVKEHIVIVFTTVTEERTARKNSKKNFILSRLQVEDVIPLTPFFQSVDG